MCSRVGGGVSDAPPGLAVQGEEAERPLLGGEGADPPTSRGHCECTPGTGGGEQILSIWYWNIIIIIHISNLFFF